MLKDYSERPWNLDNSETGIRIFPPTLICLNLIRFSTVHLHTVNQWTPSICANVFTLKNSGWSWVSEPATGSVGLLMFMVLWKAAPSNQIFHLSGVPHIQRCDHKQIAVKKNLGIPAFFAEEWWNKTGFPSKPPESPFYYVHSPFWPFLPSLKYIEFCDLSDWFADAPLTLMIIWVIGGKR